MHINTSAQGLALPKPESGNGKPITTSIIQRKWDDFIGPWLYHSRLPQ
jgi:hypothetical protein